MRSRTKDSQAFQNVMQLHIENFQLNGIMVYPFFDESPASLLTILSCSTRILELSIQHNPLTLRAPKLKRKIEATGRVCSQWLNYTCYPSAVVISVLASTL